MLYEVITGPCVVTQVKTVETDGYESVQLGFGEKKEKNTTKARITSYNVCYTKLLRS